MVDPSRSARQRSPTRPQRGESLFQATNDQANLTSGTLDDHLGPQWLRPLVLTWTPSGQVARVSHHMTCSAAWVMAFVPTSCASAVKNARVGYYCEVISGVTDYQLSQLVRDVMGVILLMTFLVNVTRHNRLLDICAHFVRAFPLVRPRGLSNVAFLTLGDGI